MSTRNSLQRQGWRQVLEEHKLFLHNLSYIGLFQILTLILPLISYPYLIRIIGAELYGQLAYAQAIVAFAIVLVNFGINIMATKEVAIHRDHPETLDKIVTKVYVTKTFFFLIASMLYLYALYILEPMSSHKALYLLSFGYCLPEWLLPVWYFQGIEKMKYVTLIDAVAKVFFTALIFFVITQPEHYLRIPIVQVVGTLIGASIGFYLLMYREGRRLVHVGTREVFKFVQEAAPFFMSRVSVVTIGQLSTLFVGRFLGYVEVAWLDLARKVVNLLMIPSISINSAIYPRIAHSQSKSLARKGLVFQTGLGLLLYILLYLFTPFVIQVLGGSELMPAIEVVRVYGLLVILYHINYYIGSPVMIPFGLTRAFNLSVVYSLVSMCGIYAVLYLTQLLTLHAFVWASIATELIVLGYRGYHCHKQKVFHL